VNVMHLGSTRARVAIRMIATAATRVRSQVKLFGAESVTWELRVHMSTLNPPTVPYPSPGANTIRPVVAG
jgi:hypothetical protein